MITKLSIFAVMIILVFLATATSQSPNYTMQIELAINNTENNVFVPGEEEVVASTLSAATYTSPPDFFLASYLNEKLHAIVFSQEIPISIAVDQNTTHHFLTLDLNLSNAQAFLVFTKGDDFTITNRIPAIESSTFLEEISPSFAYPFETDHPIRLLLTYPDIDIQGRFIFRQGVHTITIESNKTAGKKILVINETIG